MAAKIVGLGLALSVTAGVAGCEPRESPALNANDDIRASMDRCGLTTRDLYMIDFAFGTSTWVYNDIKNVPCDQVPQWLSDYRTEYGPQLDFMAFNPQELQRPTGWSDLRYLLLMADKTVLIDFDAGMVYSSPGPVDTLDPSRMDDQPLRQTDAQALVSLMESTTASWPYPEVRGGDVLPTGMNFGVWRLSIVTRDKSLYRFDQTTGAPWAPAGFVDVYDAFWALAKP